MADRQTYKDNHNNDRCSACHNYVENCDEFGCHPVEEKPGPRNIFAGYGGSDNPNAIPMDADGNYIEPEDPEFKAAFHHLLDLLEAAAEQDDRKNGFGDRW